MDFDIKENSTIILRHIMDGLERELLIGNYDTWAYGSPNFLSKRFNKKIPDASITFCVSAFGIEFFLWAHGLANTKITDFNNSDISFLKLTGINIENGSEVIADFVNKKDSFWWYGDSSEKDNLNI